MENRFLKKADSIFDTDPWYCLDAFKDGSGKKTTFSERGSDSEDDGGGIEVGVMSMKAFYKVPKSMMVLMLGIIGFLIVLILLLIIISVALIASTKTQVNDQKIKNEDLRAKIVDMEYNFRASCNDELRATLNQVRVWTKHIRTFENQDLPSYMQKSKRNTSQPYTTNWTREYPYLYARNYHMLIVMKVFK